MVLDRFHDGVGAAAAELAGGLGLKKVAVRQFDNM